MKKIISILILGTVFLGGCCCCECRQAAPETDAEGFTYLDGRHVAPDAPSDWYIIRYEQPSNEPFTDSRKNFQRWLFSPRSASSRIPSPWSRTAC